MQTCMIETPHYHAGTKSLFALSSAPEVTWSIMASFMLFVILDKYAWDFYMENAKF